MMLTQGAYDATLAVAFVLREGLSLRHAPISHRQALPKKYYEAARQDDPD